MNTKAAFDNVEEDMLGMVIPCYICGKPLRTVTERDGPTNCVIKLEDCDHEPVKKEGSNNKPEKKATLSTKSGEEDKNTVAVEVADAAEPTRVPYVASTLGPGHCIHCGDDPCVWLQLEQEILDNDRVHNTHDIAGEAVDNEPNRARRKRAFQLASRIINGHLGKGNRKKHSQCVEEGVRSLFPDEQGNHMGFMEE